MIYQNSIDFGGKVCDALGLDKNKVKSFEIRCDVDEPLTINVTMYADMKIDNVVEILKKYRLVEIE